MTDEKPAPRSKRMIGFYVGTGVVLALLVGGWLARTPLRISYLEREIRRTTPMGGLLPGQDYPHLRLIRDLVDIGPPARAAVERLMADRGVMFRPPLLREMERPGATWALPMLVREVELDREAEDWAVLGAVDGICDRRFSRGLLKRTSDPTSGFTTTEWTSNATGDLRRRILDWWQREGKAKYGRGGE